MPLILSQWAYFSYRQSFILACGSIFGVRCHVSAFERGDPALAGPHSKGGGFRSVRFIECCHQLLHALVPFSAIQRDAIFSATPLTVRFGIVFRRSRSTFVLIWRAVALDPLHFGVHPAGLLHLPHTWVRSHVSLAAPLQLAVKSLVVSVQLRDYTFRQDRSGQTLSDHERIVAQRGEDFAQHSRLFGVTGHPLHLSLELVRCDRPLPVILQRLRVAQIIFDLFLDLRLRHHLVQRRLGTGVRFWPDAMLPVHIFDGALISDPIREGEGSLGLLRWRRGCRSAIEAPFSECEWNRANAQEQKHVKHASNNLGLNGGIGFFHVSPSGEIGFFAEWQTVVLAFSEEIVLSADRPVRRRSRRQAISQSCSAAYRILRHWPPTTSSPAAAKASGIIRLRQLCDH